MLYVQRLAGTKAREIGYDQVVFRQLLGNFEQAMVRASETVHENKSRCFFGIIFPVSGFRAVNGNGMLHRQLRGNLDAVPKGNEIREILANSLY